MAAQEAPAVGLAVIELEGGAVIVGSQAYAHLGDTIKEVDKPLLPSIVRRMGIMANDARSRLVSYVQLMSVIKSIDGCSARAVDSDIAFCMTG